MSTSTSRVSKAFLPWCIGTLVFAVYGVWLLASFVQGHDPRDYTIIDRPAVERCHASSVIGFDPHYRYSPNNREYDGAWYYLIALDPGHAACYVDNASYRYGRILYPMAARALALGQPGLIPWMLIIVNLLALAGGTLLLALWLRRRETSPWFALLYGLYPGLFVSLWRDLTEPLSYGFTMAAVFLFDFGGRRRFLWAGLCFGLASLARETALLFAAAYVLTLLSARQWRSAAVLLSLSAAPFILWKLFLRLWLGASYLILPDWIPFHGILQYWPWRGEQGDLVLTILVPALLCLLPVAWALRRRMWTAESLSLGANVLWLVILLPIMPWVEYFAAGRATAGVVLAALLCLPLADRLRQGRHSWLWLAAVLWFMPWYALLPLAWGWILPQP